MQPDFFMADLPPSVVTLLAQISRSGRAKCHAGQPRSAVTECNIRYLRQDIFLRLPILDDDRQILLRIFQQRQIFQWVAVDQQQVGQ